jgi:CheY-like chemotaxis protein
VEANNNLKIAVVDDDANLTDLFSKVIQKLGYSIPSVYKDGTSIVQAMAKDHQTFDVIIMDYRMPEMNGIEAAKIIHRYRNETKIIIATGYDFVMQKAIEAGFLCILKPFSSEQLAEYLADVKPRQVINSQSPI